MLSSEMSPQQRWALRQRRSGRCTRCGRKRKSYTAMCDRCQPKATEYMRRYRAAQKLAKEAKKNALKGALA